MSMIRTPHPSAEQGFTLVVIAALFVAFSIIASVAIERNTTVQLITRRDATVEQLNRLSNAIIEYGVFNSSSNVLRYPCPAALNLLTSDVSGNFGAAVTNCHDGSGDLAGPPVTTSNATSNIPVLGAQNTNVIRGMVPVLTLSQYGIGINDAFDPWNNRIMYVVNRKFTVGNSSVAIADQSSNPTIADIRTGYNTVSPDFILISYGRDGVGGLKRTSATGTADITCTTGGTVPRFENCDTDNSFLYGPPYIHSRADGTSNYTSGVADQTKYFDDILTFYRQ